MGTQPRIIGVSGVMRTGKDSVAALLGNYGYTRLAFADPLRKVALDIDPTISLRGASAEVLEAFGYLPDFIGAYNDREGVLYGTLITQVGYEQVKEVPDFRRFLQRLGTEGVRNNFGQNAWVDLAVKTIRSAPESTKFVKGEL